jgi:hypothetical protein
MRHLKTVWLVVALTLCAGCSTIGFMQDMMEISRGTLVVTAGTDIAEMKKRTTFDLGAGTKWRAEKTLTFANSARFDWQLPGTNLTFKDCSNYFLTTDKKGETIEDIQIITAQKYLIWDELKAEMYEIEKRLLADGWMPVRFPDGSTARDYLRKQLEKPDLSAINDSVGGATYGKADAVLILFGKRPPTEEGENPYKSDKFTHFVRMETRAKWEDDYKDSGYQLPK